MYCEKFTLNYQYMRLKGIIEEPHLFYISPKKLPLILIHVSGNKKSIKTFVIYIIFHAIVVTH